MPNLISYSLSSSTTDCTQFERIGYTLIQIFGALLILSGSVYFLWANGIMGKMTIGQIILSFIVIVVVIGMFLAAAQLMGGQCSNLG